jgi:hypothetical protein
MNSNEIMSLATIIAEKLHIKIKNKEKIEKELSKSDGEITILMSEHFTLWIDRYYIAYSSDLEPQVYYAYLTMEHIKEELRHIFKQLKTVTNSYEEKTLISIKRQFLAAQALMKDAGIDFIKTNQLRYVWSKPQIKIPLNALVLTLCHTCVQNFRAMGNKFVVQVDYNQQEKDKCAYCNYHYGFDYAIWKKKYETKKSVYNKRIFYFKLLYHTGQVYSHKFVLSR